METDQRLYQTDQDFPGDAPKEEPARQYYFMDRCRSFMKDFAAGRSRRATAAVVTFGCQMNARDSEKLEGMLLEMGYETGAPEDAADFVIFNTCTVRENANEHLYGRLGRLKAGKKEDPDRVIAVCGCMMQEADEVEKLKKKYPYVDLIFGTHNLYRFPELLCALFEKRQGLVGDLKEAEGEQEILTSSSADALKYDRLSRYASSGEDRELQKLYRKPVVSVWKDSGDIVEALPSKRKYPFKQGINISFGCDNFCSYCIVPFVRGREKSRAPEEILAEIRQAAGEGVKEIMLLGQNVNSYRGVRLKGEQVLTPDACNTEKTDTEPVSFSALLKEVDELAAETGIERIRFMTSHPKDLSDELIEVMKQGRRICHQFHLPLQSGSDPILKRMNRHYDQARFLERAAKLREAMPDIAITTDIIVGFPGETEEDFLETLKVVEQVRFDAAFTFIYSKREGTPAAVFQDQVDPETVKNRFDRLLKLQNRISGERVRALVGRTLPVLFEEPSEYDAKLLSGKLENGTTVHVPVDPKEQPSYIGQIRTVRLTEARGFYYLGELSGPELTI